MAFFKLLSRECFVHKNVRVKPSFVQSSEGRWMSVQASDLQRLQTRAIKALRGGEGFLIQEDSRI